MHVNNYEDFMAEYDHLHKLRFNPMSHPSDESASDEILARTSDERGVEGGGERERKKAESSEEEHSCDHTGWECRICGKTPFVWRS